MKTKEVILEGYSNVYVNNYDGSYEIFLSKEPMGASESAVYKKVKCKVILEVPVPERSVTITEGELSRAMRNINDDNFGKLRKELFGSKG